MATGFGELVHIMPLYGPVSSNTSDASQMVDLLDFTDFEFIVQVGLLGSSDGTGTWVLIPYLSSTTTAAGAAVDFYYRMSTTTALTDAMGDVTSCANTGLSLTSDNDYGLIVIKIASPQGAGDDKRYAYLAIDNSTDDNSTGLFSVMGAGIPRHKQASMKSSTA